MSDDVLTYGAVAKAIANALTNATGVVRVEAYDELSEGIPDTPMLQVYPDAAETDIESDGTGNATFGAGVRRTKINLFVDGYAKQRSYLGEDIRAQIALIDAIDGVLSNQRRKPFFGLPGIQQFRWSWQRVTYPIGDGSVKYAGVQFLIEVYVF